MALLHPGNVCFRSFLGAGTFDSKDDKIPSLLISRSSTVLCPRRRSGMCVKRTGLGREEAERLLPALELVLCSGFLRRKHGLNK